MFEYHLKFQLAKEHQTRFETLLYIFLFCFLCFLIFGVLAKWPLKQNWNTNLHKLSVAMSFLRRSVPRCIEDSVHFPWSLGTQTGQQGCARGRGHPGDNQEGGRGAGHRPNRSRAQQGCHQNPGLVPRPQDPQGCQSRVRSSPVEFCWSWLAKSQMKLNKCINVQVNKKFGKL